MNIAKTKDGNDGDKQRINLCAEPKVTNRYVVMPLKGPFKQNNVVCQIRDL